MARSMPLVASGRYASTRLHNNVLFGVLMLHLYTLLHISGAVCFGICSLTFIESTSPYIIVGHSLHVCAWYFAARVFGAICWNLSYISSHVFHALLARGCVFT